MSKSDYYELLGVSRDADEQQIKAAYRKKALEYHPDRNSDPSAETMFKECAEAYEVLGNREKRAVYDRYGHAGMSGQSFQDVSDIFSSFSDIFEDFFGFSSSFKQGRARHSRTKKGDDIEYELRIGFRDSVLGVQKKIEYRIGVTCTRCHGTRVREGASPSTCSKCHGSGQMHRSHGIFRMATVCFACEGAGTVIDDPCSRCRGKGRITQRKDITVKIPPGVDNNMRLRIGGAGDGGYGGAENGDLYVLLLVDESKRYRRHGNDLIVSEEISMTQAALGCEIQVKMLDGVENVTVPAGSQYGDHLRVVGQGVPVLGRSQRGDLVVELQVLVPRKLKKEQRELLERFAAISDDNRKGGSFLHRVFSSHD